MWSGERIIDYDYSYTELDFLPEGWKKAFGEQMAEEIAQVLKSEGVLDEWYILELKEKFGAMRLYPSFTFDELNEVIDKYEALSAKTCVKCGNPATHMTAGWILPYCSDCLSERDRQTAQPIQ